MIKEVQKVIMITAKEDWPDYVKNLPEVMFWDIEDPKDKPYDFLCNVRNKIKRLVEKLVKEIE